MSMKIWKLQNSNIIVKKWQYFLKATQQNPNPTKFVYLEYNCTLFIVSNYSICLKAKTEQVDWSQYGHLWRLKHMSLGTTESGSEERSTSGKKVCPPCPYIDIFCDESCFPSLLCQKEHNICPFHIREC